MGQASFTSGNLVLVHPHDAFSHQAPNKALFSILGKSNLRFAGMSIAVNISVDGLNLMIPTTRQVRAIPFPPLSLEVGLMALALTLAGPRPLHRSLPTTTCNPSPSPLAGTR